jgi:hypothetical protein
MTDDERYRVARKAMDEGKVVVAWIDEDGNYQDRIHEVPPPGPSNPLPRINVMPGLAVIGVGVLIFCIYMLWRMW